MIDPTRPVRIARVAPKPTSAEPPETSLLGSGARASFARLRASLPGAVDVALAPLAGGRTWCPGDDAPAHGWSVTKIPVLVALLRARGADGLTPAERGQAEHAITESDNQAILELFSALERLGGGPEGAGALVQRLFRLSGDARTVLATATPPPGAVTTFGQTRWAPSDAARFFRALAFSRLLPPAESSYVLRLMQRIVPADSWGVGAGGFAVPVAFKGGWGPEPGGTCLVRQSGVIDPGSPGGVAVSIVAYPPAGAASFDTGAEIVTRTARWLRGVLGV